MSFRLCDDFQIGHKGDFTYGVYRGVREIKTKKSNDAMLVAVKVWQPSHRAEHDEIHEQVITEVESLKRLQHQHIIPIWECTDEPQMISIGNAEEKLHFVVMAYCKHTLRTYLQQKVPPPPDSAKCIIAKQMSETLAYIHSKNIAHRDVKPDNILVEEQREGLHIKLHIYFIDFALGKMKPGSTQASKISAKTGVGTMEFAAPEVLKGEEYDAAKADVWSLGCVIFSLYNQQRSPMTSLTDIVLAERDEAHRLTLLKGQDGSFEKEQVLAHNFVCLLVKPKGDRPRLKEVEMHPYFWGFEEQRTAVIDFRASCEVLEEEFRAKIPTKNPLLTQFKEQFQDKMKRDFFDKLQVQRWKEKLSDKAVKKLQSGPNNTGDIVRNSRWAQNGFSFVIALRTLLQHGKGDPEYIEEVQKILSDYPQPLVCLWDLTWEWRNNAQAFPVLLKEGRWGWNY